MHDCMHDAIACMSSSACSSSCHTSPLPPRQVCIKLQAWKSPETTLRHTVMWTFGVKMMNLVVRAQTPHTVPYTHHAPSFGALLSPCTVCGYRSLTPSLAALAAQVVFINLELGKPEEDPGAHACHETQAGFFVLTASSLLS